MIEWDTNTSNYLITYANIGMLIGHYFCCCYYFIFVTAPQHFIKFDIHCARHFQSLNLTTRRSTEQDGQQKCVTAMLPNSHTGWLFTCEMLSFVIILWEERVAIVLSLTFSFAPEVSLEKKAVDLQLSSGMTRLYFCKISQVISGETLC